MMAGIVIQEQEGLFQRRLSLASNKKKHMIPLKWEGGREASRGSIILLLVNEKDSMGGNKDPLFIIATNVETNTIYTGLSSQHPGLFRKRVIYRKIRSTLIWNDDADNGEQMEVMKKYATGNHKAATLHQFENGMYVFLLCDQSATTEGQFAVWYIEELVGSELFLDWCCIFGINCNKSFFFCFIN
jgi:tRNA-specific 2-thiouridylase